LERAAYEKERKIFNLMLHDREREGKSKRAEVKVLTALLAKTAALRADPTTEKEEECNPAFYTALVIVTQDYVFFCDISK